MEKGYKLYICDLQLCFHESLIEDTLVKILKL